MDDVCDATSQRDKEPGRWDVSRHENSWWIATTDIFPCHQIKDSCLLEAWHDLYVVRQGFKLKKSEVFLYLSWLWKKRLKASWGLGGMEVYREKKEEERIQEGGGVGVRGRVLETETRKTRLL